MLEALPSSQWNAATAAHLLNRAGFGGSPQDVEALHQMGLNGAVNWLVNYEHTPDTTPAPDWAKTYPEFIVKREAVNNITDPDTRRQLDNAFSGERRPADQ